MENKKSQPNREEWKERFRTTFLYHAGSPMEGSQELNHNNVRRFIESEITQALAEQREGIVKKIKGHVITDWSGEAEVYEEIENIIASITEGK